MRSASSSRSLEEIIHHETSIDVAMLVQEATIGFCLALRELLEPLIGESAMEALMECAFRSVEKEVERFASLERQILTEAMHVSLSTPSEMDASVQLVFDLVDSALTDCMRFTGGSEIHNVAMEIESFLVKHVTNMTAALREIRSQAIPDAPEKESDVTHVLDLLKIGRKLIKRVDELSEKIVQMGTHVQERLRTPPTSLDLMHLRYGLGSHLKVKHE